MATEHAALSTRHSHRRRTTNNHGIMPAATGFTANQPADQARATFTRAGCTLRSSLLRERSRNIIELPPVEHRCSPFPPRRLRCFHNYSRNPSSYHEEQPAPRRPLASTSLQSRRATSCNRHWRSHFLLQTWTTLSRSQQILCYPMIELNCLLKIKKKKRKRKKDTRTKRRAKSALRLTSKELGFKTRIDFFSIYELDELFFKQYENTRRRLFFFNHARNGTVAKEIAGPLDRADPQLMRGNSELSGAR